MSATMRQPSLRQLHAAAKKRWGKNAFVELNPRLPDAETRSKWSILNEAASARIKEIEAELKSLAPLRILRDLVAAAQFVVDVNGDHPSIDGLRKPLADASRRAELEDDRKSMEGERRNRPCHSKRYKAGAVSYAAGFGMSHIYAEADTAAELMELIKTTKD